MPLLFQPPPPPCVTCGVTTVIATASERNQRVFVVRCPACGCAGTYSLDYDTPRELSAPTPLSVKPAPDIAPLVTHRIYGRPTIADFSAD
jgi:hypothetical protein